MSRRTFIRVQKGFRALCAASCASWIVWLTTLTIMRWGEAPLLTFAQISVWFWLSFFGLIIGTVFGGWARR